MHSVAGGLNNKLLMRNNNKRKFGREKSEFDQQLVDIARVTRIVAGGRRFRFRATVVIGDKKGRVGMGIAKGPDVSVAVNKAVVEAKKELVKVPIINNTIPHEIEVNYCGASVFLKPAKSGIGVIAGGAVRSVMELAGVRNIVGKMNGTNNKINNIIATLMAFKQLRTVEQIAAMRGKKVEDLVYKKKVENLDKKELDKKEIKTEIKK